MSRVVSALLRALVSQLHPKMLALVLLPFLVAVVFWVLVAWWIWDPLNDWLRATLFGVGRHGLVAAWISTVGLDGVGAWLSAAMAVLLLAPLMFALALMLVAVVAMPIVNRHLVRSRYRDVLRCGQWSLPLSLWTALVSLAWFAVGYVSTVPLWLVPFLGLLVPWFWWSWLTARVMRLDSLAEHANGAECKVLIGMYRREYFLLAFLITGLNYVPPLFVLTPVLSALAFGHFSLSALRDLRALATDLSLPDPVPLLPRAR